MDYINKLLQRAATLPARTSPSPTPPSGNTSPLPKSTENEVKVQFSRNEFTDVRSTTHLVPETSSANFNGALNPKNSGNNPKFNNLDQALNDSYVSLTTSDEDDFILDRGGYQLNSDDDCAYDSLENSPSLSPAQTSVSTSDDSIDVEISARQSKEVTEVDEKDLRSCNFAFSSVNRIPPTTICVREPLPIVLASSSTKRSFVSLDELLKNSDSSLNKSFVDNDEVALQQCRSTEEPNLCPLLSSEISDVSKEEISNVLEDSSIDPLALNLLSSSTAINSVSNSESVYVEHAEEPLLPNVLENSSTEDHLLIPCSTLNSASNSESIYVKHSEEPLLSDVIENSSIDVHPLSPNLLVSSCSVDSKSNSESVHIEHTEESLLSNVLENSSSEDHPLIPCSTLSSASNLASIYVKNSEEPLLSDVLENSSAEVHPLSPNLVPSTTPDSGSNSEPVYIEHARELLLPNVSSSLLTSTDCSKSKDSDTIEDKDIKFFSSIESASSVQTVVEGSSRRTQDKSLSSDNASNEEEIRLNDTFITRSKTDSCQETERWNIAVNETDVFLSKKDKLQVNENSPTKKQAKKSNERVNKNENSKDVSKKVNTKGKEDEEQQFLHKDKLYSTLLDDKQNVFLNSVLQAEQCTKFEPQNTSFTVFEQSNFEGLKAAATKQVANDIFNSSLELPEEKNCFVKTSEIFLDPASIDFLINRLRARYVTFDPSRTNSSMLPQGNTHEEQNGKSENISTPKRNPAIAAIDRLLFYSPLSTSMTQKTDEDQEKMASKEQPVEEPKSNTPLITDINISKELELVRATVLQLEEELEKQKKEYEAELEKQKNDAQEQLSTLQTQLAQEVKSKKQMTVVVEEYEKSISRLLTERERDRTNFEQEKVKLQEEVQSTNVHLANMEVAFNDVHQKYEKLKGAVSAYKNNEAVLKESIQENIDTIKGLEMRYDQLKNHAISQLEKANYELDAMRKQHEDETVTLHAMVKKAELKNNSLAELVEQKTKEIKELTKILDEVIARVGHQNVE